MTEIRMDTQSPKVHSIRFETDDIDAAVRNVYVTKAWLAANPSPHGVKVTIEPIGSTEREDVYESEPNVEIVPPTPEAVRRIVEQDTSSIPPVPSSGPIAR